MGGSEGAKKERRGSREGRGKEEEQGEGGVKEGERASDNMMSKCHLVTAS